MQTNSPGIEIACSSFSQISRNLWTNMLLKFLKYLNTIKMSHCVSILTLVFVHGNSVVMMSLLLHGHKVNSDHYDIISAVKVLCKLFLIVFLVRHATKQMCHDIFCRHRKYIYHTCTILHVITCYTESE